MTKKLAAVPRLQSAMPAAIHAANKKHDAKNNKDPKPLINAIRRIWDLMSDGELRTANQIKTILVPEGYKPGTITGTVSAMTGTNRDDKDRPYLKVFSGVGKPSDPFVYKISNSFQPDNYLAKTITRMTKIEKAAEEARVAAEEAEKKRLARAAHLQNMRDKRAAKIAAGELTPGGRKIPKLIPQDKQGGVLPEGHIPRFNLSPEEAAKGPGKRGPYVKKQKALAEDVSKSTELVDKLKNRTPEEIANFLMDNLSAREMIEVHELLGKFFK